MQSDAIQVSGLGRLDLSAVFGLAVAVLVVAAGGAVLRDGDTFTHIAAGGWMLEHLRVLRVDPFTWTFAGQPWTAHEWLSEVVFAAIYRVGGLSGVVLLTAAAAAVTFSNLVRHLGRWCGWWGTVLLACAALICVMPSVVARPHVLALPVLELWVAGLLVARDQGRAPGWGMLALMAVWANLHGGFAFGIAMAVALAVEATVSPGWRRTALWRWWAFAGASVLAAMVTPQGWRGLLFPVELLRLDSLRFVQEWQPLDLTEQVGVQAVVLALVALLGTGRVQVPPIRLLLLLGLLHLSIAHSRHVLLFGIAGALIMAEPVGRGFAGLRRVEAIAGGGWVYGAGLALVAVLRLAVPVTAADGRAMPVSALAQLPPEVTQWRMLNSVQFGGYMALSGLSPAVDGRAELFGDAFNAELRAMASGGRWFAEDVAAWGIGWAILAVDDPLVGRFDALAGWRRQYADGVAVVFVRG